MKKKKKWEKGRQAAHPKEKEHISLCYPNLIRVGTVPFTSLHSPYSTNFYREVQYTNTYICCCCFSVTKLCLTLCNPMDCSTPGSPVLSLNISQDLLKFMCFEQMMPSHHLILCHPLLLLPSILPSIRVFSNELVLHIRWPKYWSFSFSISPSSQYSGLISLAIDWFDLLAVHTGFRSLLQHHSSNVSNLWDSAFFIVQLSQLYVTTGKTQWP